MTKIFILFSIIVIVLSISCSQSTEPEIDSKDYQIAYTAPKDTNSIFNMSIFLMDLNSRNTKNIIHDMQSCWDLQFSRDGNKLLYISTSGIWILDMIVKYVEDRIMILKNMKNTIANHH